LRKFFGNGKQEFAGGLFLVQHEMGNKIRHDTTKKSFLRWLVNYAYEVTYLKSVPAKAFSPPPKVQSCVICLLPKEDIIDVDFDTLYTFLDTVSGFKRKTLGKIEKMLSKKNILVKIPEDLQHKRLEEL
jgi:16S rRNA (adenine1518-N6/adenine1519-N6)-dimethyltransferase